MLFFNLGVGVDPNRVYRIPLPHGASRKWLRIWRGGGEATVIDYHVNC
jgi:hypothetical protein